MMQVNTLPPLSSIVSMLSSRARKKIFLFCRPITAPIFAFQVPQFSINFELSVDLKNMLLKRSQQKLPQSLRWRLSGTITNFVLGHPLQRHIYVQISEDPCRLERVLQFILLYD